MHTSNLDNAEIKALHLEMALANGAEAYISQQEAIMSRPDSRPLLATIRVPTTVIVGDGDKITPVEVANEMADGIAGSRLAVIPTAGHMALVEQPEHVRGALREWLEG